MGTRAWEDARQNWWGERPREPRCEWKNRLAGSLAPPKLDLHFAARAGHPDLLRARFGGGAPVHRVFHDVPHPGEPPVGAGDAAFASGGAGARREAVESEFELFVCRVCHNEPFICATL
jgi:hypothetical protein